MNPRDLQNAQRFLSAVEFAGSRRGAYVQAALSGMAKSAIKSYKRRYKSDKDTTSSKSKKRKAIANPWKSSKKSRKSSYRKDVKSSPQGDSSSYAHMYTHKSHVSKSTLAMFAPNHLVINNGQQLATTVGVQNAASYSFLTGTDLNTMVGKLISVGGTTAYNCYVSAAKQVLNIKSASTFSTKITIYDVIYRRDATANTATPAAAWTNGIGDELAGATLGDIGGTPYQSDLFNLFCKIQKVTVIELLPGTSHIHTTSAFPNKKIHHELLNNVTGNIMNLTCSALVVIQGGPGHDSTTKTQVTATGASVDILQDIHYDFTALADNSTNYYHTNNLVTSFTVGAEVVNEELGELQNAAGITATAGVY